MTTVRVQSQAKAYLKIFLNAELHANKLVYKHIIIFFKNRLDLFFKFQLGLSLFIHFIHIHFIIG